MMTDLIRPITHCLRLASVGAFGAAAEVVAAAGQSDRSAAATSLAIPCSAGRRSPTP